MAPRGTTRARRESGTDRREELLGIAAELFATKGYAQTTVRDIAEAAGMLSGSLYHHFASKEAMLVEVLRDFMEGLLRRFTDIVDAGGPPSTVLEQLIRSSFQTIHEQPHAVALYQNETSLFTHQPEFAFVLRTGERINKLWLQVFAAGSESGEFRAGLDHSVSYRFARDSIWSTVEWYRPRGRLRHDKLAEQFIDLFYGGLLAERGESGRFV
ncbi:TetR/AcrR family transcriptional regulator [Tsukamurella sp. 8F]|uniref:TetR/AcrR family transcriptional regulator n=1 Tax=unclassified Tsukamurella TaxID=2633480 RepID=UPI0023B9BBF9|nr:MULTISPECIES: TetR/AcrR family transcriptional regulator [unclassified Tsukamurella]MDF0528364.1 TetR/AcrR family transcriptional regulator [Tsukamurella sp. 8J]MDF0586189.1 TetR/AcrR family transcriptional regulator [Tsukamurella sp. 8F]